MANSTKSMPAGLRIITHLFVVLLAVLLNDFFSIKAGAGNSRIKLFLYNLFEIVLEVILKILSPFLESGLII